VTTLRGRLATLLLVGYAVAGVWVVVGALVLAAALSGLGGPGDLLADLLTWAAVLVGVLAVLPGVALAVRVRNRRAGDVVATLYGALVVALTAGQVREDTMFLVPHLAGLVLVVCAFPWEEPVDSAA
jgi:hypothetical protein